MKTKKDLQNAWKYLISKESLTRAIVLETHHILFENAKIEESQKGNFRKLNISSLGEKMVSAASVPFCVEMWTRWNNSIESGTSKDLNLLFLKIFPFENGNEIIGHLLMNWRKMKKEDKPILPLKKYMLIAHDEYYK